ncbi:division plane positioning ATPase MipZ [Kordiimonas laminariae]|uniref:division plane positioning ATPase MipZ n=1 Tax=Kordiimonas laminariae TaxID=2917717 RepID=UPI001FF48532|nr:division plane positioning ATPase MipZ [Kordiimonas laminariae]MCK0069544.1 division plane positioning ATPase MipZ [Kordiimonas laminariae]
MPDSAAQNQGPVNGRPYLIVLGNEKGGSGKSTTAMHVVIALLRDGYRVGTIDLDARQKSLTRYIENRQAFCKETGHTLPMPEVRVIPRSEHRSSDAAEADEKERFEAAYIELADKVDVLVIDCPGSDTYLSRLAHTAADTLVTPVNDSFVDLDLLARVDPDTHKVIGPSLYAEMVWKARQRRSMADGGQIDWIVLRNRVGSLHAKNKERVEGVLSELTKRIGIRYIPGLGERVIYRELFLKGLTLMDLKDTGGVDGKGLSMSHVAARQEVRNLIDGLALSFRENAVS